MPAIALFQRSVHFLSAAVVVLALINSEDKDNNIPIQDGYIISWLRRCYVYCIISVHLNILLYTDEYLFVILIWFKNTKIRYYGRRVNERIVKRLFIRVIYSPKRASVCIFKKNNSIVSDKRGDNVGFKLDTLHLNYKKNVYQ